jgi:hypothetical protein
MSQHVEQRTPGCVYIGWERSDYDDSSLCRTETRIESNADLPHMDQNPDVWYSPLVFPRETDVKGLEPVLLLYLSFRLYLYFVELNRSSVQGINERSH